MNVNDSITISIVSHGQAELVGKLLNDLAALQLQRVQVVLTLNVPEALPFDPEAIGVPLRIIKNPRPVGFGANHNAAFRTCTTPAFCILNPDLRLHDDPFPALMNQLTQGGVGAVAPLVLDERGAIEDSARRFPTMFSLLRKALSNKRRLDYEVTNEVLSPDWVAGMFVLFNSEAFRSVEGFDEGYFLYYEDVDICRRLRHGGWDIRLTPRATVTHSARRQSRRNFRYARWHLQSMLRYLCS